MKPFVPSILRPSIPFAALTQAYVAREQQLQQQEQPTFGSLIQQAGVRHGLQSSQPIMTPQQPVQEALLPIPEEVKQEVVANLSQRPQRNEHYLDLPEIDYDEEAKLIQEENPDIQPEQLQEVIEDMRQQDVEDRQEIDLMNRIADQLQANQPEFRQNMAMQIVTGAVQLVTFDQGLKLMKTAYDTYKDSQARANMLSHDMVPEKDYSYEDFLEVVKQQPKAAQCKRHVWLSPKSQQLRSILVCSDKYGVRHYQNR